ncbi:MAG: hypothetical protein PHE27_07390, partial [Alphaproteobacteria bacterium]|nr:hypothetical protein [Alphaproteobacteria bacterium]
VFLTAVALVIAVNLICKTIIATEHETISLLHVIGAEDLDIARHFQMHTAHIVMRSAATGFAVALIVISTLLYSTQHIADLSALTWEHWISVGLASLLVPVCATIIASIAARLSVLRLIKMFP